MSRSRRKLARTANTGAGLPGSKQRESDTPLLTRPAAVKVTLTALSVVCGALFLLDFSFLLPGMDKHAHYAWENWPGFYAVYGFVSCFLLVILARMVLRPLVKRDEDYYGRD